VLELSRRGRRLNFSRLAILQTARSEFCVISKHPVLGQKLPCYNALLSVSACLIGLCWKGIQSTVQFEIFGYK
jgi:hypothetical protein